VPWRGQLPAGQGGTGPVIWRRRRDEVGQATDAEGRTGGQRRSGRRREVKKDNWRFHLSAHTVVHTCVRTSDLARAKAATCWAVHASGWANGLSSLFMPFL
jgi:hypothetical protein